MTKWSFKGVWVKIEIEKWFMEREGWLLN